MPHSAASHLGLHCLPRPLYPNTYGVRYIILSTAMAKLCFFSHRCVNVTGIFIDRQGAKSNCMDAKADLILG